MPFVSESQRRWMYSQKPEMAQEWQAHTPKGKKLPKRVKKALPFDINFKIANTAVAPNVGPASNQLAGFGQSMLGSVSAAIPKSTMFAPRPSPEMAPILGGPTGGPGTPMSGGALPALPSLGTLKGMGRTNAASSSSASSSGTTTTAKSADWGSVFGATTRGLTNAATKVMPSLAKSAPKVEAAAARSALPNVMPKVTAQGSMSSGPSVTYPTPRAYSPQAAPPPTAKLAPPGSVVGQPPTAQVISKPPTAAPALPAPAAVPPTSSATLPSKPNFWTAPLDASQDAATQGIGRKTLNAATRVITPGSTLSEAGRLAESSARGQVVSPLFDRGRSWSTFAQQNLDSLNPMKIKQNLPGFLNAGAQIASIPSRLSGEAALRGVASGSSGGLAKAPLWMAGGALYSGMAAGNNLGPDGKPIDTNRPMMHSGMVNQMLNPITKALDTVGAGDPIRRSLGVSGGAPAGYGSIDAPFTEGARGLKSLVTNPVTYAGVASKGIANAGVGAFNAVKEVPTRLLGGTDAEVAANKTPLPFGAGSFAQDFKTIKGTPPPQAQPGTTPPVSTVAPPGGVTPPVSGDTGAPSTVEPHTALGIPDPRPGFMPGIDTNTVSTPNPKGTAPDLTGSATTSGTNPQQPFDQSSDPFHGAVSSGNNFTTLQKGLSDIDQKIADANTKGDAVTASALSGQKQQMQAEAEKHKQATIAGGEAIGKKAANDQQLQIKGAENLAKELPEGTPPSFISSMWKMMSSNPWASGLLIAGLGLSALSMLGAFGNSSMVTGLAGLASAMVGAGMMPKEMWTQISAKIFGGAAAPKPPSPPVAPPANGVAAPKQAPTANAPAVDQGKNNPAANQAQNSPTVTANPDIDYMKKHPVMGGMLDAKGVPDENAVTAFLDSASPDQLNTVIRDLPASFRPMVKQTLQDKLKANAGAIRFGFGGAAADNAKFLADRL